MKKVQPLKIILINAANCQYAEFDLSDSLHLVALNNRGKTSIINTLQFLYIDNYKEVDMGHSLDKTWKHYFPQLGSYVLFELNTLAGRKVFGLAATGMGAQPEKFVVDAAYQAEDFLVSDGETFTPRKPENLFPLLGARLRRRGLEAKQHRDFLKPLHPKKNPDGLGIIGDTNDYPLFKRLFKQLLQLKGITIKDLKDQIEQVNQRMMEKEQVINVQREYSEPYAEIQKRKSELQRLQFNEANIAELLDLNEKQANLRGRLRSYFLKADSLFVNEDQQLQNRKAEHSDSKLRLQDEKLPAIRVQKEERQHKSNALNQRLGVVKEFIRNHEKLGKLCEEIVIELEQETQSNLEVQVEALQKRLYQAEETSLAVLEKTLHDRQQGKEEYQAQLQRIADTLFARLKNLLDIRQQKQLYRITNNELWRLFEGQGFELHDPKALQDFLQQTLPAGEDDHWDLPGLRLKLSGISTTNLHALGNPDFLRDQIRQLDEEISKLQQQIETVRTQEQLRQKLSEILQQIETCKTRIAQYQQWQQAQAQYQEIVEEQQLLDEQINQLRTEIDQLEEERVAVDHEIRRHGENITKIEQEIRELNRQKIWIEKHPPDQDWTVIEVNYDTLLFADLHERYQKNHEELQKKNEDVGRKLAQLRSLFPQMTGLQDALALHYLSEQLEAIPEKEKSINDQWRGIFTSFSAHCRGMIDSVDAIDSYLADLNRLLGKQQISNLQAVKILLKPNQWHTRIRRIQEWREDDLPLFGGINEAEGDKLQEEIKPLLDKGKISIADLYDLKLLVLDQNAQEKQYESLQLESNGTSITVKTIIFISMINKAMEGKQRLGENIRIPFYVDEIDSLDDVNAQNIHDTAQKLGLIPVFASPKGSGICKRLYQLDNNQYGKLNVRQKSGGKLLLLKPTFERVDTV
ncbi:MAG: hypothetical protein R3F02_22085 [Thiolinea sp.]